MTERWFTVGVEEEYHLVDARTFELRGESEVVGTARRSLGDQAKTELSATQLEVVTPVCDGLGELRGALRDGRWAADRAARRHGCRILVASTHPLSRGRERQLTPEPHYRRLVDQWRIVALQQAVTGCHVHVGLPDPDTAIAVMDRARVWLPTLLALTTSSPLWQGDDTGYASYRTQFYGLWSVSGAPEPLGDRAGYDRLVKELVATGIVPDESMLYWDIRPSARYPTLEFRIGDMCTRLDDAVAYAGVVRSLTRTLAGQAARGEPVPRLHAEVLRAARWRAARDGLTGDLYDPVEGRLRPAADVVRRLLALLRADLTANGEWDEVSSRVEAVLADGTSADGQRRALAESGDLGAVSRWVLDRSF